MESEVNMGITGMVLNRLTPKSLNGTLYILAPQMEKLLISIFEEKLL